MSRSTTTARRRIAVAATIALIPSILLAQSGPADRARAVVETVRAADSATSHNFVKEGYSPAFLNAIPLENHVGFLQYLSGGRRNSIEVVSIATTSATEARAVVRNPLTEELDTLVVLTEATAPHRITRLGRRAGGAIVPERATKDAERVKELDRYVRKLAAADAFSGVVLLAKDGKPLYHEAFGIANRDYDVPITRDARFNLGSANKNMTSVMIGQLVEEGKLSWDDPLSKFVPDFPDAESAKKIRIKHLLSHTSGLGSYFNETFVEGSRARWRSVDDFMRLARPDTLRFEPGTRWAYSNTGMLVLGKVIEVVTRKDYFTNAQTRIFDRVGMKNSGYFEMDGVNKKLATGYIKGGRELRNNLFEHVVKGGPAGGGWSTAEDMLAYSEALRGGKLVRRETFELMRSPKPELQSPNYGYGFVLFEGPNIWGHGGDFPGIDFDWNGYGDTGYTLVVLANYDGVNDPIKRKVGRMLRPVMTAAR